jgi:hypothetical protein
MGKTYDPEQVSLSVGGFLINFDEVTVEFDEDQNTFTAGTHGEVTRTKNLNRLATWTILLPHTHSHNDILSALAITDATFVCSILDLSGTALAIAPEVATMKRAAIGRTKESGQNTWTFKGKTELFPGGNT